MRGNNVKEDGREMYQEMVKFPAGKPWETMLYIAFIVAGVFVVSLISWLLSSLGLPWVDLLAVAAVAAWACVVFLQRVDALLDTLMDTELIVARVVGSREKNVFWLDVGDIERMGAVEKPCKLPTVNCALPTKKLRAVQAIYHENGAQKRVLLQPSDRLLEMMRSRAAGDGWSV